MISKGYFQPNLFYDSIWLYYLSFCPYEPKAWERKQSRICAIHKYHFLYSYWKNSLQAPPSQRISVHGRCHYCYSFPWLLLL